MGLLYILPISEKEKNNTSVYDGRIILKSYGLPKIFWAYYIAALIVILIMIMAINYPLQKLTSTGDSIDLILAFTVWLTLIGLPFIGLGFFFYKKTIIKKKNTLNIIHSIFGVKLNSKSYTLETPDSFEVSHHMDSPNVARQNNKVETKGFENRGYFQFYAIIEGSNKILVDRSSQRRDLLHLHELLTKY
jgi:glucan phosphoethanolaminetransferase (alkaline phosphatase superfamily)